MNTISEVTQTTTKANALNAQNSTEEWLLSRVGALPRNSLGWFRCGVGFYNKKDYAKAIECFQRAVELDPLNVCMFWSHVDEWAPWSFLFHDVQSFVLEAPSNNQPPFPISSHQISSI